MRSGTPADITGLLRAWSEGDQAALEKLIPLVKAELRRIARRYLERGRPDATLETAALINEANARLINLNQTKWQDRSHFFGVCARAMRSILVDYARARSSAKRGGGVRPVPLEDALAVCREQSADVVAVHEALNALRCTRPGTHAWAVRSRSSFCPNSPPGTRTPWNGSRGKLAPLPR
ncbi:MAG: ECF-type sigma factor [Acidobacteriota bacterium]